MRVALLEMAGYVAARWTWGTRMRLAIIEHGRVVKQEVRDVCNFTPAALMRLLGTLALDTLVCGGIPPECERALKEQGVEVIWGVIGTSRQALLAVMRGQLRNDGVAYPGRDAGAGRLVPAEQRRPAYMVPERVAYGAVAG